MAPVGRSITLHCRLKAAAPATFRNCRMSRLPVATKRSQRERTRPGRTGVRWRRESVRSSGYRGCRSTSALTRRRSRRRGRGRTARRRPRRRRCRRIPHRPLGRRYRRGSTLEALGPDSRRRCRVGLSAQASEWHGHVVVVLGLRPALPLVGLHTLTAWWPWTLPRWRQRAGAALRRTSWYSSSVSGALIATPVRPVPDQTWRRGGWRRATSWDAGRSQPSRPSPRSGHSQDRPHHPGSRARDFSSLESPSDGWSMTRPLLGRAPIPEYFGTMRDALVRLAKEAGVVVT